MRLDNGWVALPRSVLTMLWQKKHENILRVYLYILSQCNIADFVSIDESIPRGTLKTSIENLSKECELSEKIVRNAVDKLVSAGILGKRSTSNGTYLSVCNYDSYKDEGQAKGEQRANEGQLYNNNNNSNKENNKKQEGEVSLTDLKTLKEKFLLDKRNWEVFQNYYPDLKMMEYFNKFIDEVFIKAMKDTHPQGYDDFCKYFINWTKYQTKEKVAAKENKVVAKVVNNKEQRDNSKCIPMPKSIIDNY